MGNDQRTSATLLKALAGPKSGDAWAEFVERYRPLIQAWAEHPTQGLRIPPHEAEDVAQNVLMKLSQRMAEFEYDPSQRFRAWLKIVVRNEALDWLRRVARQPARAKGGRMSGEHLEEIADRVIADNEAIQSASELVDALDSALMTDRARIMEETAKQRARRLQMKDAMKRVRERVTPETWRAFLRRKVDGAPAKEVAAELGKSVHAVLMAVNRVLVLLRKELADFG